MIKMPSKQFSFADKKYMAVSGGQAPTPALRRAESIKKAQEAAAANGKETPTSTQQPQTKTGKRRGRPPAPKLCPDSDQEDDTVSANESVLAASISDRRAAKLQKKAGDAEDELKRTSSAGSNKRGRRAQSDYLERAKRDLKALKMKYDQEKDSLDVGERAKHRNRISALESRIKKR